jgi:hypothetical protein
VAGSLAALESGSNLESEVAELGKKLGLVVDRQVKAGKRIWGAERRIDLVFTELKSRKKIGIECKVQDSPGSAEEKIPTTIKDIEAWPIPGIVVIGGNGFSRNMIGYMFSTGKVVSFEDLESWLKLFFAI